MTEKILTASVLALTLAACATAPSEPAGPRSAQAAASAAGADVSGSAEPEVGARAAAARTPQAVLDRFAPAPTRTARIDYELIDEALDVVVFNGGPSTRARSSRPDALVGTRFVRGHDSPFRLEGNKIFFSQFDDETRQVISEYRDSLERIGREAGIASLARDEQLAYWLNLHNVVVIDELAQRYPLKRPRREKIGPNGETLHDAPIIDLGLASPLSLRDVREIVYTHWDDPRVIYGFFRGDIGGPQVRSDAYTGRDVNRMLDRQAEEFVNSLRGVARGRNTLYVNEIYDEARPHYFASWPDALKQHLLKHAEEEVTELILTRADVKIARYEDKIADLAGGESTSDLNVRDNTQSVRSSLGGGKISPEMIRMVQEYRQKLEVLRRQGKLAPRVIIIDLPGADEDDDGEE